MALTFGVDSLCTCRKQQTHVRYSEPCSYSRKARRGDPETSHSAASSITSEKLRESQARVLWVLNTCGPLTDEDIYAVLQRSHPSSPISPSGARTRRAELVALGKVRDSGRRERLASGRMAVVWEAV